MHGKQEVMGGGRFIVGLVFLIFFVISFLTNILGPLVPDILSDFRVSLAMAAVLPFSFFYRLWGDVDTRRLARVPGRHPPQ